VEGEFIAEGVSAVYKASYKGQ